MGDLICAGAFLGAIVLAAIILNELNKPKVKRRKKSSRSKPKWNGNIHIYRLMDGRKPFYVGQTRQDPQIRLAQHMDDLSGNDKSYYISRMRRQPTIEIICTVRGQAQANKMENKYMRKYGRTNMKRA